MGRCFAAWGPGFLCAAACFALAACGSGSSGGGNGGADAGGAAASGGSSGTSAGGSAGSGGKAGSGGAAGTGGAAGSAGSSGTGGAPPGGLASAGLIPDYDSVNPFKPPPGAIHIDPTNTADTQQDGTLSHPYESFDKSGLTAGATYVVKRGTTLDFDVLGITQDDLTFAAYGSGSRPVLQSSAVAASGSNKYAIELTSHKNITFRDLVVNAPDATSAMRFQGQCENIQVENCKLTGGGWALRSFSFSGLKVISTEVSDTDDDGIFMQGMTNIEIAHCYVHDVNQNWKPPYTSQKDAAGDGIQFDGCNHWHVHENVIDRTSSANKFCFISNNPAQDDGVLELNVLSGPRPTGGDGGASIYLGDGTGLVIRDNLIKGPSPCPFYSHADDLHFYGNLITGVSGSLYASATAAVDNNVFYDVPSAISGGSITARNNIFALGSATATAFDKVSALTESNNLFTQGAPAANSISGDPKFVDAVKDDFHLLSGSAAIDKGTNVGLTKDIDGVAIPQGAAPDIGAYEFKP